MNLQAATKELRGKPPRVAAPTLLVELAVVVGVSIVLAGMFGA